LFGEGLATALAASETEGIVTLFIWIRKTIFLEITFGFEDIWFGEFARMSMDSPNVTLLSETVIIDCIP
jgi:hypothetical protein